MAKSMSVADYRRQLPQEQLPLLDAVRSVVATAHEGLVEGIKWNGPNYTIDGQDRITLSLARDGSIRVVVHRGAKAADGAGFAFPDPDGLAEWPNRDRGVIRFRTVEEVVAKRAACLSLFQRWIAATT